MAFLLLCVFRSFVKQAMISPPFPTSSCGSTWEVHRRERREGEKGEAVLQRSTSCSNFPPAQARERRPFLRRSVVARLSADSCVAHSIVTSRPLSSL